MPEQAWSDNTILVLEYLGASLYASATRMRFQGAVSYAINSTGILTHMYTVKTPGLGGCRLTFKDPMDDMINDFREIALRMSIVEAAERLSGAGPWPGSSEAVAVAQQTVPYTSTFPLVRYAVSWRNAAAAVAVSLLGPCAALGLFWDYWGLGRKFSLSPLEIANAFFFQVAGDVHGSSTAGAVLVERLNGNAEADEAAWRLRKGGDTTAWYGVVDGANRLGMGVQGGNGVRRPLAGEVL